MKGAKTVMVEEFAHYYKNFEMPERYPITKGKSTKIDLLLEDPLGWAKDLETRIDRGYIKRKDVRIEDVNEKLSKMCILIKVEIGKYKIYKINEFLNYVEKILKKSIETTITNKEFQKQMKTVKFRDMLSNRSLIVVIFGTVCWKEILDYGLKAYKNKELLEILKYETFIDEFLSYLQPLNRKNFPDKPIASVREIKESRWDDA